MHDVNFTQLDVLSFGCFWLLQVLVPKPVAHSSVRLFLLMSSASPRPTCPSQNPSPTCSPFSYFFLSLSPDPNLVQLLPTFLQLISFPGSVPRQSQTKTSVKKKKTVLPWDKHGIQRWPTSWSNSSPGSLLQ